jgi:hypothetical protein
MESWNNVKEPEPNIPVFQYSTIPILREGGRI